MRIAELCAPRRFRLIDGPIEDPGPGEIQAKVEVVGICGSDLHYFFEGAAGDTPCVYPMVMGHEPTGTVVKTGPGVSGWSPGDRAALEPALYCYHCEFCRTGHHNVCANIRFLSSPPEPGFFRDYVNLPAHNLLPLPPEVSLGEGTLFEPLAVALHVVKLAALGFGETAAVFGAGPIGLLTVLVLKLSGAGRVWSIEPVAHRRELARLMGADACLDPCAEDPARKILADTGGRGVDLSIDCAAKGNSINQSLLVPRKAGRAIMVGIASGARVPVDFSAMRRRELTLINIHRSNHDSEMALALLREQPERVRPMLTHELPLEQVERGFGLLERYEDGAGKVLINLGR